MGAELHVEGLGLAPGVLETIISLAAKEVEGVSSVGSSSLQSLRSRFTGEKKTQAVDVAMNDEDGIVVAVHLNVFYGFVIPEVADGVRVSVAHAISDQIGFDVASVDVFVDGIDFAH
ncbi:MAG: Asp23/Gls24 family envelope stress response protein [Eggerthellaceae bacterium]|nr:Asp23/Gls24 family envelope stress response protein [Eggerthellaceae bacterium]